MSDVKDKKIRALRQTVADQMGEIDALKADAARYRYLRGQDLEALRCGGLFVAPSPGVGIIHGEELDAAIDAAMGGANG